MFQCHILRDKLFWGLEIVVDPALINVVIVPNQENKTWELLKNRNKQSNLQAFSSFDAKWNCCHFLAPLGRLQFYYLSARRSS